MPNPNEQPLRPVYKDRNLQIVFSITLMAVLGVSSVTPAFPQIARALQVSARQIGLLITVFTLPGLIMTPVLGIMADRLGRKKILIPSLLLFAVFGTACAYMRSFHLLLLFRFIQGIGAASLGSLNATLIGDLYSGRERPAAMGYNASVLSVGTAGYPAIGGALAVFGWYFPFLLPLLAIPVVILVITGLNNPEPSNQQNLKEYLRQVWQSVLHREVAGLFIASIITFIILYGAFLTYLPILLDHKFSSSPLIIGLILSSMSVTTAITSSQLGRLTRRFSEKIMLRIAFGFYAAALILFPLMPGLWQFLLPTVLFGIGNGLNIPNIMTLLTGLAPLEYRGAFMSLNGMVLRGGQTIGPLLMGAIYGIWQIAGPFIAGAVLALAAILILFMLVR
ncbi:MAG: MFS transporter [Calditrichia bacterium]